MTFGDPPIWSPPPESPPPPLPYASPRRRNPVAMAAAIVGALALLVGGAVYTLRDTTHRPPHPKEWDPRVLDIVAFDEQHRGLSFKEPVFVDFLDAQAYSERVRTEEDTLTDEQKKQLAAYEGELRALGLSNSNLDLLEATNELQDTGTLAFYDPQTERVTVRGTEMNVDIRVTLIHEFVHVLQDQQFGIGRKRTSQFETSQEASAFRTVLEGDAVRIENEYIKSLSAEDKAQYEQVHNEEVASAVAGLADVPLALQALQSAPYLLGPPFVELLDADGHQKEVDEALKTPPATDEHVLDPPTFHSHQPAITVQAPVLPDGLTADAQVDDGDFGALTWYVVLAERIDPLAALQAVDGWGGDSYIAYTQNDKTCMRLNWQGDTSTDQQEMQDALNQWAAAMPAGAATVTADGGVLHLQACDLGPDSGLTLNNRANDAIQIPGARSQFMLDAVKNGGQRFDAAFKYGDCMVHHIGFENFVAANQAGGDGLPPEVQAAIQAAFAECRSEVGG